MTPAMQNPAGPRVLVTGLPGVGKTSVAMTLAAHQGLPHIEVDRMYYGPGYATREDFVPQLAAAIADECWCLDDFGAPESRDLIWQRADTLVWLDLPWGVAFVRAVRRTWRRLRTDVELIPGCRESWLGWGRPYHPVRLALTSHRRNRRELERRLAQPEYEHLSVIRLRSRREVEELLGPKPYKLAV
ncbi:MAG: adenylate kinase [Frankiales bacterium]|nr:adenylate kinase [Frankiales bacterium]